MFMSREFRTQASLILNVIPAGTAALRLRRNSTSEFGFKPAIFPLPRQAGRTVLPYGRSVWPIK
jgi:hypothetical protein